MKRFTSPILLVVMALSLFACEVESVNPEQSSREPLFEVFDAKVDFNLTRDEMTECLQVRLVAGQYHDAGYVSAVTTEDQIIITYLANPEWTINATHLSIGDCNEQWVPTTGSDNPKVGHFEHSSEHPDGTNEVVYTFPISELTEDFCFAAHAEVSGATGGETAWGEGTDFDGNNWAMFVDALLTGCLGDGGGGGGDDPVLK